MTPTTHKVGRFTVAIGLVALGTALLIDNLSSFGATSWIFKFWPVLLIGIGVEYLIRTALAQRSSEEVRLRFDVGGVVLLLLVFLFGMGINTFRNWSGFEFGPISVGMGVGPGVSRDDAAAVPAGTAKELEIDLNVGTIYLRPAVDASEIRVEATYTVQGFLDQDEALRRLESIELDVTQGDKVNIGVESPLGLNNTSVKLTVYAPQGLKVAADTGAGSIDVTGYKGDMKLTSRVGRIAVSTGSGSLNIDNGSGSVTVTSFEGPVTAETNVGSLDMRDITGALQLNSNTGSIIVNEYQGGKLSAETGTGRINAQTSRALSDFVLLKTNTGAIEFTAPKESSMRVSAQTRTGSLSMPDFVSVTRKGTSSSAVGTSGDGTHTVTLEAGTGSVRFYAR